MHIPKPSLIGYQRRALVCYRVPFTFKDIVIAQDPMVKARGKRAATSEASETDGGPRAFITPPLLPSHDLSQSDMRRCATHGAGLEPIPPSPSHLFPTFSLSPCVSRDSWDRSAIRNAPAPTTAGMHAVGASAGPSCNRGGAIIMSAGFQSGPALAFAVRHIHPGVQVTRVDAKAGTEISGVLCVPNLLLLFLIRICLRL